MGSIKETNIIVHANSFSTAIDKKMTPVEQRMLAIYLSKINPNKIETRSVSFALNEYETLMGLQRYNITQLKECAKNIIAVPVVIDKPTGGFSAFPVFSSFDLDAIDGEWSVSINCSDKALPFLFDLKKEFMQYALWNILNLQERNHQQLYRILKQYEKLKRVKFELQILKFKLGLDGKHNQFKEFRRKVLEPCQKALSEKTDIRFDYELIRKGRKVHAIKFTIQKNTPNTKQPLLSDFVAEMAQESMIEQDQHDDQDSLSEGFQLSASGQARTYSDPDILFFAEACNNEFSEAEMNRLIDALRRKVTKKSNAYDTIEFERFHLLQTVYLEMCARPKVYSRVNYLLKILEPKEPATT